MRFALNKLYIILNKKTLISKNFIKITVKLSQLFKTIISLNLKKFSNSVKI